MDGPDRRPPRSRGSRAVAAERRAADEARIRERVLGYLRDRRAFEETTAPFARRMDEGSPLEDLPDLERRFAALHRAYRTEAAMDRYGAVLTVTARPLVDPDRVRIVRVTIRGDQASLRTVEDRLTDRDDLHPTDDYTYRLERVDGDWWIIDRMVWIDGARIGHLM